MKKALLSSLILLYANWAHAQYEIASTQTSDNPATFLYSISTSPGTPVFDSLDLITWFFPDGQFRQQEIHINAEGKILDQSNQVLWSPYTNAPSGPDHVLAYVAKKGGPGKPPQRVEDWNNPVTGNFSGTPDSFAMEPGQNWQVNRTWDFSPGLENFLIVSYKMAQSCDTQAVSFFTLIFDHSKIQIVDSENLVYHSEMIDTSSISNNKRIEISNLAGDGFVHHNFIKLKLDTIVHLNDSFDIEVRSMVCGVQFNTTLRFAAKGVPHDPNTKRVNHPVICNRGFHTDLMYSIQFQNDGNAPLDDVLITDSLPPQLVPEISTPVTVAQLDPANIKSGVDGNNLQFTFKNLKLPGLSQIHPHYAYDQTLFTFSYSICTQPNLPVNDSFMNNAGIAFYNGTQKLPLAYTNEAWVYVKADPCYFPEKDCSVPITEVPDIIYQLNIAPNPFSDHILIAFELVEPSKLHVVVRDLDGRVIATIAKAEYIPGSYELYLDSAPIPRGMYFLEVATDRGRITRKLLKM